jgi:hypothetical protein
VTSSATDRPGLELSGQDLADARYLASLDAVEVVERIGSEASSGSLDDVMDARKTGWLLEALGWHDGGAGRPTHTLEAEQADRLAHLCRWFADRRDEGDSPEVAVAERLLAKIEDVGPAA